VQYAIYPLGAEKFKWRNSKSFLKNCCIALKLIFGGASSRTLNTHIEPGAVDINGTSRNISDAYQSGYAGRTGGRLPLIHVGDASSPRSPSPNDFKLEHEIGNFSASPSPDDQQGVTVSGNKSLFDYSANVTFTSDVTVTEIGLSTLLCINNYQGEARFMLLRDVVSPPVTIPADTPYVVRYRIIMEA